MRIVVALGGNALIARGEPLTVATQRRNVQRAVEALAPLAHSHQLVITHGNGPQVGLLALQAAAYQASAGEGSAMPLDVLGAESEGMVGYLIELSLANALPSRQVATLLTQVVVDAADPAFANPSKPIGPLYDAVQSRALRAALNWRFDRDGAQWRRVVPSPRPQRVIELAVIRLLLEQGVIVICAGGGGIPIAEAQGRYVGVEAVIDKDHASALLARGLGADVLLLLTDVDAVYTDWGRPTQQAVRQGTPATFAKLAGVGLPAGSMGPKVAAAIEFVAATGRRAAIGSLDAAAQLAAGDGGTQIMADTNGA